MIGEDLFAIAVDQPFRFPAAFTFLLRAFATLEGIGKALDPDFKFAVSFRVVLVFACQLPRGLCLPWRERPQRAAEWYLAR